MQRMSFSCKRWFLTHPVVSCLCSGDDKLCAIWSERYCSEDVDSSMDSKVRPTCVDGTAALWDISCGLKTARKFQYHYAPVTCAGFPLSCLEKIPGLFQNFPKKSQDFFRTLQDPKTSFPGRSILHVRYWIYCTRRHPRSTHLTKCTLHKDATPTYITYGMPNILKCITTLFQ